MYLWYQSQASDDCESKQAAYSNAPGQECWRHSALLGHGERAAPCLLKTRRPFALLQRPASGSKVRPAAKKTPLKRQEHSGKT